MAISNTIPKIHAPLWRIWVTNHLSFTIFLSSLLKVLTSHLIHTSFVNPNILMLKKKVSATMLTAPRVLSAPFAVWSPRFYLKNFSLVFLEFAERNSPETQLLAMKIRLSLWGFLLKLFALGSNVWTKEKSIRKKNQSKADKKRDLVALRLAMLEDDSGAISNVGSVKQDQSTPEQTPQPLEIIRPTNTKGVQHSKEQSSYSNSSAIERAEEVQASLPIKYPSFVKNMLNSHIASRFWLGLQKKFCVEHLPQSDTMMDLIDERGEISRVKYLAAKVGLSAGWRGFSIAHNLEEGDAVVFQLIKKTTFKVYVIRKDGSAETDSGLGLLDLDTDANLMTSNDNEDEDDDNCEGQEKIISGSPKSDESHDSEVLDWIKLSEPGESVNLESFDKFSILVNGVCIDAKFPDHIRRKYYNLCINQNSCLHEKLIKDLNCTLVIGIINETVNISDAIRDGDCRARVPESDLLIYDRTLQSFELMGMSVHSIRLQIHRLLRHVIEKEETIAMEAKVEREIVAERMKDIEVKLKELRKQMEGMDEEIEVMQENTKMKRLKLQKMESFSCD